MSLDDSSQRNLDKVGGIIATGVFGICLIMHVWRWLYYKCHPLAATSIYLILRTVGWLLTFIGAFKDDALLNKRGYIVNSLAFWLFVLASFMLAVKWDASRRAVKSTKRSYGAIVVAVLACLVMGALEAAGQITWLNDPEGDPSTVLKVAEVGFVVLTGINALFAVYFNFKEGTMYQRPSVRWTFFITAALLLARSVFWMLVGLHVIKFTESNRQIFLYSLGTSFEMLAALFWSFSPASKHLRPHSNVDFEETPSVKPVASSIKPLRGEPASPVHRLSESDPQNGVQDKDSRSDNASRQDSVAGSSSHYGTNGRPGAYGSYSSTYNSNVPAGTVGTSGSYSSPYVQNQSHDNSPFVSNPWTEQAQPLGASTNVTNSPSMPATMYDSRPSSYGTQTVPMMPVAQYPSPAPFVVTNEPNMQRQSMQQMPPQQQQYIQPSPVQNVPLQRYSVQQLHPQQQQPMQLQEQQSFQRMSMQPMPQQQQQQVVIPPPVQQHYSLPPQPQQQYMQQPMYIQGTPPDQQSALAAPPVHVLPGQTVSFASPAQVHQVAASPQHPPIVRTPYPPAPANVQGYGPHTETSTSTSTSTPAFHNDYFTTAEANSSIASMQPQIMTAQPQHASTPPPPPPAHPE
ncbi:hypothetical protein GGI15_001274 [Coemansia interrupta]|uniref:Uncharacterized protein n=1 Tax=Coemansia interrupta TaxID=1126814 RepID=A0A9W8HQI9_9FUNG|nr:hypothetical protein GGI15_001274 [Coemansia interrupta]